ncbi:hypothetical protein [Domibacillus robiginosus]|uniref:hypothetical protein n=1 Tax=Domibacillus robiginosus TaxID=1071054 RepID=UPI00067A87ED|nr:hypothetical protein [Domibacillus robiginosus]
MEMKNTNWHREIVYRNELLVEKKSRKGRSYYCDAQSFDIKYVWCTGCESMHTKEDFGLKKGREGVSAFHNTCKNYRRGGPAKVRSSHKPDESGCLKCKSCLKRLPADCFYLTRKEKNQFSSSCKKCELERKRLRRQAIKLNIWNSNRVEWDQEKVINIIKKLHEENLDLSVISIRANNSNVYTAAIRHFESWRNAVEKAGFNYQKICKLNMTWNVDEIKRRLILRQEQSKTMQSSVLRLEEPDLYGACLKIYGGYREAFEDVFGKGSFLNTFLENKKAISFGFELEKLVKEVLYSLDYKCDYQKRFENGTLRPDFYSAELDQIFEVKLSEYTDFKGFNTFLKYGHLAEYIMIIYLQGEPGIKGKNEYGIEMASVTHLINQVKNGRSRKILEEKAEELKKAITDRKI